MPSLVDTSAWSLALRRDSSKLNTAERRCRDEIAGLVNRGELLIVGPIRQELLAGIRTTSMFHELRDRLREFEDEPCIRDDYERAAESFNLLRAAGIQASSTDALICAVSERLGAQILTTDNDFRRYGTVLPIRLHMISEPE
ncbi:MAG: PIN domain-containing protein [Chloroflexi bacterium]|nr:PIN domain-containing protein [Chloroflexota bacterium]